MRGEKSVNYLHSPEEFQAGVKHHHKAWAKFHQHHVVRVVRVGADDDSFLRLYEAVICIETFIERQQSYELDIRYCFLGPSRDQWLFVVVNDLCGEAGGY